MSWRIVIDEDAESELREAAARAGKFLIPFALILFMIMFSVFYYGCEESRKRFVAQSLQTVVSKKYIDNKNRYAPTIILLNGKEEINFFDGRYHYDSLQVGDSLYKPAGSEYYFLLEYRNGVRTLRKLQNDKH